MVTLRSDRRIAIIVAGCLAASCSLLAASNAAASSAADISKAIDDLQDLINKFDKKTAVPVDKIDGLISLLVKPPMIGQDQLPSFVTLSTELTRLLNDPELRRLIQEQDAASVKAYGDANKAASDLAAALDLLQSDAVVSARFVDLLTKLSGLINNSLSNQTVLATALVKLHKPGEPPTPSSARADFDAAWGKITDTQYRIHVIRAEFGDLRDLHIRWRERRLCEATPAAVSLCEHQTDCKLPADKANAKPFDQQGMCGYDPAPQADQKHKGVQIKYTCVLGGQPTWDALARDRGTDPTTNVAWLPVDINTTQLQSSVMSIRCPFPPPAPGG